MIKRFIKEGINGPVDKYLEILLPAPLLLQKIQRTSVSTKTEIH
jgi:hypothetical protein|tara:strand:+ start:70130 stop:70261 length:132 start_codon:yes stop_codon:yes gene_type:complete